MKMFRLKFQQNCTINEEFDFWGIKRVRGAQISKIPKSLIQNGCTKPHLNFQHFSSIRQCLKFGGTDSNFGGLKPPPRWVG